MRRDRGNSRPCADRQIAVDQICDTTVKIQNTGNYKGKKTANASSIYSPSPAVPVKGVGGDATGGAQPHPCPAAAGRETGGVAGECLTIGKLPEKNASKAVASKRGCACRMHLQRQPKRCRAPFATCRSSGAQYTARSGVLASGLGNEHELGKGKSATLNEALRQACRTGALSACGFNKPLGHRIAPPVD